MLVGHYPGHELLSYIPLFSRICFNDVVSLWYYYNSVHLKPPILSLVQLTCSIKKKTVLSLVYYMAMNAINISNRNMLMLGTWRYPKFCSYNTSSWFAITGISLGLKGFVSPSLPILQFSVCTLQSPDQATRKSVGKPAWWGRENGSPPWQSNHATIYYDV